MQYRSPSPDNALPTPPQSPSAPHVAHTAINLLNSLETFYQQERYWVHHTRAALELTITKGIDAPPRLGGAPSPASSSSLHGALSPASSTTSDATAVDVPLSMAMTEPMPVSMSMSIPVPAVKAEPDVGGLQLQPLSLPSPPTRWTRRKNVMRLKIDGISVERRTRRPLRATRAEPGPRLLEMFSELMDARMESCQRVQRMVRNANRADLYMR